MTAQHRWQFSWTAGKDPMPILAWTRYAPVYEPTGRLLDGVPEQRSTDLQRLARLGMHPVPATDDYWRFLAPSKGWAIAFSPGGRFMLWDPTGNVELAGSAEEAGADPDAIDAVARKVQEDGEIVLFSGQLWMTDESSEIEQARMVGNLLVGAAAYVETPDHGTADG